MYKSANNDLKMISECGITKPADKEPQYQEGKESWGTYLNRCLEWRQKWVKYQQSMGYMVTTYVDRSYKNKRD